MDTSKDIAELQKKISFLESKVSFLESKFDSHTHSFTIQYAAVRIHIPGESMSMIAHRIGVGNGSLTLKTGSPS